MCGLMPVVGAVDWWWEERKEKSELIILNTTDTAENSYNTVECSALPQSCLSLPCHRTELEPVTALSQNRDRAKT